MLTLILAMGTPPNGATIASGIFTYCKKRKSSWTLWCEQLNSVSEVRLVGMAVGMAMPAAGGGGDGVTLGNVPRQ